MRYLELNEGWVIVEFEEGLLRHNMLHRHEGDKTFWVFGNPCKCGSCGLEAPDWVVGFRDLCRSNIGMP